MWRKGMMLPVLIVALALLLTSVYFHFQEAQETWDSSRGMAQTVAEDARKAPFAAVSSLPMPVLPLSLLAEPAPTPPPDRIYGCPSSPCPPVLDYAVNGCKCGGQVYDDEYVDARYCCKAGFSDKPCPESITDELLRESVFGATEWEVEWQQTEIEIQGWPVYVHEKAVPAFEQVKENLKDVDYEIVEKIHGYAWRNTAGMPLLGYHAFGIAVDINPSTNPTCGSTASCRCYNDLITDMPPEFVQAFKDAGFIWGGDWQDNPDPMHFEWHGWRWQLGD